MKLLDTRGVMRTILFSSIAASYLPGASLAEEISLVSGATGGTAMADFRALVEPWEKETGHTAKMIPMPPSTSDQFGQYRLWLAAGNADIDLYLTDVIWAAQLADQFVDLSDAATDLIPQNFESIIESQTVDGRLVALPVFTDAPALFYRKDLLDKHGAEVPSTWQELTEVAAEIQQAERADGNEDMWGFVWQGSAYEGLTCNALEWVSSFGGGQFIEPDGTISVNNPQAVEALELASSWIGEISPKGIMGYQEEESRGIWQVGNAVFMRNWPYAYGLAAADDSPIKGKFDVAPLPSSSDEGKSAATLGGWNVAVSKHSEHQEIATSLAVYLAGAESQKQRSILTSSLPTIKALYDDKEVTDATPIVAPWQEVFQQAVPRPSAPTKGKYNEVSSMIWTAVHETLSGNGTAQENLEVLELDLDDMKGGSW